MSVYEALESILGRRRGVVPGQKEAQALREFQFRAENGKSLFEIFLDNTTQKRNLAKKLAGFFRETNGPHTLDILDIGTSKGTLMAMFVGELERQGVQNPIRFHLLEPEPTSVGSLQVVATTLRDIYQGKYQAEVIKNTWEDFDPQKYPTPQFDAIICAHTIYYFEKEKFRELFEKMTQALKPDGRLFMIARTRDQMYRFIQSHFAQTTGKTFNEITVGDAVTVLRDIVSSNPGLSIRYAGSRAEVRFPFATNPEHAKMLVGFFLQQPWENIPVAVQTQIAARFDSTDTLLPQMDGIAIVTRLGDKDMGLTNG